MIISVEEAKGYLRVEHDEDDSLIESFILSAQQLCMDILRTDDLSVLEDDRNAKVALLYCVAYFYEHREETNYRTVTLSLRALLSGNRKAEF
ncbi:head-tail connector protein [Butyrivibrio sp. WCD2001]|uniref:head-tail connector protein n=1 Tax=Butyrivibrio sp. WCD2001 TaxID=1280681 RepID=UPI0003F9AE71|nr:head-tail connector protein [Butyrivibrio sp. WCD2001]